MDNNILAGGLLGAFLIKNIIDENVKHSEQHNKQIIDAILSTKIEPVVEKIEEVYETPKRVWPFV